MIACLLLIHACFAERALFRYYLRYAAAAMPLLRCCHIAADATPLDAALMIRRLITFTIAIVYAAAPPLPLCAITPLLIFRYYATIAIIAAIDFRHYAIRHR